MSGAFAQRSCPADGEGAARKQLTVQGAHCGFRKRLIFEFHETEAAGPASCTVLDDFDSASFESLRVEPLCQCFFGFREWDISNKQSIQKSPPDLHSEYDSGETEAIECCLTPCRTDRLHTMSSHVAVLKPGKMSTTFPVLMCRVRISKNTVRKSVVRARSRPSWSCSEARPGHLP